MAETTINPFKNTRNKIVSRFTEDEEETLDMPEFYAI
jgi:Ca2+-binding EF-hand superfamily protein